MGKVNPVLESDHNEVGVQRQVASIHSRPQTARGRLHHPSIDTFYDGLDRERKREKRNERGGFWTTRTPLRDPQKPRTLKFSPSVVSADTTAYGRRYNVEDID